MNSLPTAIRTVRLDGPRHVPPVARVQAVLGDARAHGCSAPCSASASP